MKAGQTVTLVDTAGQERSALILGIAPEPGASGLKRLNLAWDDGETSHTKRDVPHETDAAKGAYFWREGHPRQNQAGEPVVAAADDEHTPKKASTTKK